MLNLCSVHNSCRQKVYVTNCPKIVLFVQFHFLVTVYFPAGREISKCSCFSLVDKSLNHQKELLEPLHNSSGSTAKLQPYSSLFLDDGESKHQIFYSLWLHFIPARDDQNHGWNHSSGNYWNNKHWNAMSSLDSAIE